MNDYKSLILPTYQSGVQYMLGTDISIHSNDELYFVLMIMTLDNKGITTIMYHQSGFISRENLGVEKYYTWIKLTSELYNCTPQDVFIDKPY